MTATDLVEIGDELPVVRDVVGVERVRRFLGLRGRFLNDGRFTDAEAAAKLGLRHVLVPGPLLAGIMARALHGWLLGSELAKLDIVFRRNVFQDEPFDVHGVVVDVEVREAGPSIDIDVTIVDEHGDRCTTGAATVVLPAASEQS
jgi:hypothetical protein